MIFTPLSAQKIQVFILAGQSNMEGQGDITPAENTGTLGYFMDEGGDEQYEYIRDENYDWVTREDVWVRYDNAISGLTTGDLSIGYGSAENQIGPELGFGHVMGDFLEDQVLIIKTAWGGKNLAVDFRPPSSSGEVGPFYTQMIADVQSAIDNIATEFPEYDGEEIEIAGFCWFQGWNDGEELAYLEEYEENMINLIADIRTDLEVPELPVVIALAGQGGYEINEDDPWVRNLQTILVPAQIAAAEYEGHTNVRYVDTRASWRDPWESPEPDFGFHWHNNGESFLRIGADLGDEMALLLGAEGDLGAYPGSAYGFNIYYRELIEDNSYGAGYSFYSAVWPFVESYPGPVNYQEGQGTWMTPYSEDQPEEFYNTIEGGLGWWSDTRFGMDVPKFIMGGVANQFDEWANGPGTGSTAMREDGHRDWDEPGGKYGVAQITNRMVWPPDGLTMDQNSNGEYLGYGYHPLPITDEMQTTNGEDWVTGNQCWTLFLNSTTFKGPVAFFIPTFWAQSALGDEAYAGQFLDTRPSDPNQSFAQEFSACPSLVGVDSAGDVYSRLMPPVYPKTTSNRSEMVRDISIYSSDAMWNQVQAWFDGGEAPDTRLSSNGTFAVDFDIDNENPTPVDAAIHTDLGPDVDTYINQEEYAHVKMSEDRKAIYFEWDTEVVDDIGTGFRMPEYYRLENNEWIVVDEEEVPESTGLIENSPETHARSEVTYLTPMEEDCHAFGTENSWNTPGPSSGPFFVTLSDGSRLTYYWYRFVDQPSIIEANLPAEMRDHMQERIEMIHTSWSYLDNYLPEPTGGTLVGLDQGQIVTPPFGLEVGYVPIVTRQELDPNLTSTDLTVVADMIELHPNPTAGYFSIKGDFTNYQLDIISAEGTIIEDLTGAESPIEIDISTLPAGLYFIRVLNMLNSELSFQKIIKY